MKDKDVEGKIDDLAQMVARGFYGNPGRHGDQADLAELREEFQSGLSRSARRHESCSTATSAHSARDYDDLASRVKRSNSSCQIAEWPQQGGGTAQIPNDACLQLGGAANLRFFDEYVRERRNQRFTRDLPCDSRARPRRIKGLDAEGEIPRVRGPSNRPGSPRGSCAAYVRRNRLEHNGER